MKMVSSALSHRLNRDVYALDMRNHGLSPHDPVHTYEAMAMDIEGFVDGVLGFQKRVGEKVDLVGHSIMKLVDSKKVTTVQQADEILKPHITDRATRKFLLTNLTPTPSPTTSPILKFRVNLPSLESYIDEKFHLHDSTDLYFDGPSLFLRGTKEEYIRIEGVMAIQRLFRDSRILDVETGHMVHMERPIQFVDIVSNFLNE
ncbi:hypothetical protein HDU76_004151 [Blyttiomyces sp. JEL0837]|nr:hypothetical protein HDU76_004151 [Blyttiomyces sp. JEL0837]